MGEANANKNRSSSSGSSRAMESLSLEINRYPRDLVQRLISSDAQQYKTATSEGEEAEEIELNLGLSLGGRFGVDKTSEKLTRSSSIAGSIPLLRDHDALSTPPVSYPFLIRTSSLPTETEEEWRKRKENQSLRRMEAKRRRSEKQKNLRGELNLEEVKLNKGNWVPTWANKQSGVVNRSSNLEGQQQQQGSRGSVESLGGSSSGLSEMESKPVQGMEVMGWSGSCYQVEFSYTRRLLILLVLVVRHPSRIPPFHFAGSSSGGEARSPASNQSLQERSSQEAVGSSGTKKIENACRASRTEPENLSKKLDSAENRGREIGTNAMEDMPCVFTKGDGPNGRRVDGILYKYGKGEEVRIMCVCHGSFHSPAEFVKHAGGSDVDHPLRHIVVNPSGPSFE
ncbi:ninja-family protein AFP2 isoform X1 [Populus trichocarpa]|uniref:ninja-family protein AFP2 isoform X1 n=1 Tax=Populus trichocarpa TaxID=3694 RepID=UPI0022791040|nr:ninja-family protein AFP2 isoform X1 [Populus trichocarpa]